MVAAAVAAALALFLAAGWYYSGEIEQRAFIAHHGPDTFDLRVTSIAGNRITLQVTPDTASSGRWNRPGSWGLESADTYSRVSTIFDVSDDSVVRELIALGPLPDVGDHVRIDSYTYPVDPFISHGVQFQKVGVPAALGTLPAWLTAGAPRTSAPGTLTPNATGPPFAASWTTWTDCPPSSTEDVCLGAGYVDGIPVEEQTEGA